MTYIEQWRALSARIRGLMEAGRLHARFLAVNSSDSYGRGRRLGDQVESVITALGDFRKAFQHALPATGLQCIDQLVQGVSSLISDKSGSPGIREERVWASLVSLGTFETELSFLLSDVQEVIRSRAERAFEHLQRLIVVDPVVREQWRKALDTGEVACEKLGAVHLLLHGIWAFKVDAAGARTDLVFQEPAGDLIAEQRFADGIVLTEWKVAKNESEALARFENARLQARRYARGALAGSELTSYRYVIVVSNQHVKVPPDFVENGVVYRHINIAVSAEVPSRRRD